MRQRLWPLAIGLVVSAVTGITRLSRLLTAGPIPWMSRLCGRSMLVCILIVCLGRGLVGRMWLGLVIFRMGPWSSCLTRLGWFGGGLFLLGSPVVTATGCRFGWMLRLLCLRRVRPWPLWLLGMSRSCQVGYPQVRRLSTDSRRVPRWGLDKGRLKKGRSPLGWAGVCPAVFGFGSVAWLVLSPSRLASCARFTLLHHPDPVLCATVSGICQGGKDALTNPRNR